MAVFVVLGGRHKPGGCNPLAWTPSADGLYNASMNPAIYLDHNATTPILPEVAEAIREASLRYGANPGSQHEPGRQARRALEDARTRIGELLGARSEGMAPDLVVFTSGGTEANNLAMFGLTVDVAAAPGHLVISSLEHPSIAASATELESRGWRVDRAPATRDGVVQPETIESLLRPDTRLVSLMLASNETGVLQPVTEAAQACRSRGIPLHTDAVQVVGKLPVDFAALGVATLSCAAHKFHGPLGIGALVVRHDVPLRPLLRGGHQQADLRPGTETVALAIGMLSALECWRREAEARAARMRGLRDRLEQQILAKEPIATIIGQRAERLPNTSNIAFPGLDRQALVMALDMAGVACSTGSACASGSSEPSAALVAMGLEKALVDGSIRLSLGALTTAAEVDEAASRILHVCQHLRRPTNR
jgi:cysteine desulfurase